MHAGFDTATDELMSGYITHIKPDFQRDPAYCTVEIWGMDGSVLMDREEKLRAWPQAKDSAIATQLFSLYGFSSVVVETPSRARRAGVDHHPARDRYAISQTAGAEKRL